MCASQKTIEHVSISKIIITKTSQGQENWGIDFLRPENPCVSVQRDFSAIGLCVFLLCYKSDGRKTPRHRGTGDFRQRKSCLGKLREFGLNA